MKGFGSHKESKNKKIKNSKEENLREEIIYKAFKSHSEGKILEAANYYQYCINKGLKDYRVFVNYGAILQGLGKLYDAEISTRKAIKLKPDFANAHLNLGNILRDLGKLNDAEISTRKAIELKPDFADAHNNLGNILKNLGKLEDAEFSYCKAIELNPDLTKTYFSLSTLQYFNKNKTLRDQLFAENILKNKSKKDKIDIYFARANTLHKEKNFKNSSTNLQLANNIKLDLNPFHYVNFIKKSRILIFEAAKKDIYKKDAKNSYENIFIVGMPRSGSTLLESIITMNKNVYDLGEVNIFEESYLKYKNSKKEKSLAELYNEKVKNKTELKITTNKWLYNYQYAGIISNEIPNSKIIHCYRNPLDNILSIYRAHFTNGNQYSSSLVDCAKVYLDQEEIMKKYKNQFQSKIYTLNYDLLVSNPNQEIKSLISWLGWKWQNSYLSPHQNPRSINTRSSIEVRSPINSKSVGGWKNYKEMLIPAIKILTQSDRYRDLIQ